LNRKLFRPYIANSLFVCLLTVPCLAEAKESAVKSAGCAPVQIAYAARADSSNWLRNWSNKLPETPAIPLTEKVSAAGNYCLVIALCLANQRIVCIQESVRFIAQNVFGCPFITPCRHI